MAELPGVDREALARPIPGGAPSGEWLRRTGTYAEVQEAVRVESGDPAYGIPEKHADWELAARLCLDALTERTKDFYLATVLVEALTELHGAAGLGEGLWFVATLHESFWDDFHPRPRDEGTNFDGRLNQLSNKPVRRTSYSCVSCLNRRHMLFAWLSLFWVGFSDVYVRLCSMGVWTDWRLI